MANDFCAFVKVINNSVCTTLRGQIKGKSRDKYYPEKRDTFEMYPGKVMHMIGG